MNINHKYFCSAPWNHIRINPAGDFVPCRWFDYAFPSAHNIHSTTMNQYLQSDEMVSLRKDMLVGNKIKWCSDCYYEDDNNKLSGRVKALHFVKILHSYPKSFTLSPYSDHFSFSDNNAGAANSTITNLQIDLGNVCNLGCVMCHPRYSSFLNATFKQISNDDALFNPISLTPWVKDKKTFKKFLAELSTLTDLQYIHLLGGETLFIDETYQVCDALIDAGITNTIVGTTTNATIYNSRLERIIPKFKEFHLGISIESVNPLNDYIRYPSEVNKIKETINKFADLRNQHPTLHLTLRITPNVFTIFYLDELLQYSVDHHIPVESCNILQKPSVLRIELLPDDLRQIAVQKIDKLIEHNNLSNTKTILNSREVSKTDSVISNRIFEYKHFLENMQAPDNVEEERFGLVKFLKTFEQVRNNSILDYAPEFTDFLRKYGY
jgi:radical SAM protein with 4Fe4S-binding SPASM domain